MKTREELLEGLAALILAVDAAAKALAETPGDDGIVKAYNALGVHAWDVDRAFEDAAGEVSERRAAQDDAEGVYVAHYTQDRRRHYIEEPGKPGTRRQFTATERDAFDWPQLPEGRHFAFTRIGRVSS